MKAVKNVTIKLAFFQTLHHFPNSPNCQMQLFSFTSQNDLDFIFSRKTAKDKMCFCGWVHLDCLICFKLCCLWQMWAIELLAESSWIPHHKIVTLCLEITPTSLALFISAGILQTFWGQGQDGDCGERKQQRKEVWGLWLYRTQALDSQYTDPLTGLPLKQQI